MDHIEQTFQVNYSFPVHFTEHLFRAGNELFGDFLLARRGDTVKKLLFLVDSEVALHHPLLDGQIREYVSGIEGYALAGILQLPGGEGCKNDRRYFYEIVDAVNELGIDRHSYVVAIGGGALLDLAGYASAVSHRGIRHIRIPTTVLSQNDSGVGVKNGINYAGKKNFLGTFAPPAAVFNDAFFLTTLSDRDWRSGIAEAVKVALIKDAAFFGWLEANAPLLAQRDPDAMEYLVQRCAALHLAHIAGGDPFEMGSSRPLDFGHWSAHKLEQLTGFELKHGEAVAMGIALDSCYSFVSGRLPEEALQRILGLLLQVGFEITHPGLVVDNAESPLLLGLQEFREHLGGTLTIMLLRAIGSGEEVHHLDVALLQEASHYLFHYQPIHSPQ
ncbi:3-dehydroquinate synthase [Flaviaesturariibacter amylovorans]|uniref:3-dehydroquinate synthase n=1 Tax=Flaviaesturariibacter amylovorans TaxID=1084520 RepID=A0ABP8HS97_9BACT